MTKIVLSRKTSIILILIFVLLSVEVLGLSPDTAIFSLVVALVGAFITATLPYVVESVSLLKSSFQCFSLIFLTRVAIAVVPALILLPAPLLVTVYSVILAFCAFYILDRRLPPSLLGFHFSNVPTQVCGGVALGVVMGLTEFAILFSDIKRYLLFEFFSVSNLVVVMIVMFLFVAFGEELLFRGLAQTSLQKDIGNPHTALIIVSLAFAVMHLGYVTGPEKILELVYVFAAATIIGYAFMKSRSLVFPVIAHGVANTILFGILPYII